LAIDSIRYACISDRILFWPDTMIDAASGTMIAQAPNVHAAMRVQSVLRSRGAASSSISCRFTKIPHVAVRLPGGFGGMLEMVKAAFDHSDFWLSFRTKRTLAV